MALRDGRLQPVLDAKGQLQPAPWTTAWDFHTEPFIAVVDVRAGWRPSSRGRSRPRS